MVSRETVTIALAVAALNGLKVLACDTQNDYFKNGAKIIFGL